MKKQKIQITINQASISLKETKTTERGSRMWYYSEGFEYYVKNKRLIFATADIESPSLTTQDVVNNVVMNHAIKTKTTESLRVAGLEKQMKKKDAVSDDQLDFFSEVAVFTTIEGGKATDGIISMKIGVYI